jgi:hypothetical protein
MKSRFVSPSPSRCSASSVVDASASRRNKKDTLTDVQRFADATSAAYGLRRIPVTVQPGTNLGIGGTYRQGNT